MLTPLFHFLLYRPSAAEAKQYFSAFKNHFRPFHWKSEIDGELLDMVFDKKRAADRRDWILNEYDEKADVVVDPATGNFVSYEDFVNKEMIHFSHADNIRSIPNAIDGLKPSQRKVLYACFKRKLKSEVKVAQLTGYCAEHTAYHHGEASLQATSKCWAIIEGVRCHMSLPLISFVFTISPVIGMAQDFVGSNNVNLLVPSGQFGTRLAGGADAASPRYIFTHLSRVARYLFPEVDDLLLTHREDDGNVIEPEFYCPVIPLLLVNGSQGIGTGWSTFIPPHNPQDVLNYIRAKLDGAEEAPPIRPFARGFSGKIEAIGDGTGYRTHGRASKATNKSVIIDELPLRCWTNAYKEQLLKMRDRGDISTFVENHTTSKVSFTVQLKAAKLTRMTRSGLAKAFKLETNLRTTNMHAFDENYQMIKFETAESIADAFFPIRLALYHDRKSLLESEINHDATVLRNKAQFIQAVTTGEIDLMSGRKTKEEMASTLQDMGLTKSTDLKVIKDNNALAKRRQATEIDIKDAASTDVPVLFSSEYDYLLNMPLSSLTVEKIDDLQREASKKEVDLKQVQVTTPEDLWRHDLDKLKPLL
jgi:DNA topoisomerase-2